jgi:hypothetical protein
MGISFPEEVMGYPLPATVIPAKRKTGRPRDVPPNEEGLAADEKLGPSEETT